MVIETSAVLAILQNETGSNLLIDKIIKADSLKIAVKPVTREQAELARTAYRKFGKGNHPAGLNYGDCFSYALAVSLNEPLLYVGQDFEKTDLGKRD